ncbi:hypothetical protein CVT24_011765 [Panaeolus cyanescens]|uniref:Amine oxidase n=1 Tax=Panaeolus cyanescens TaxID=181874 RepID=A0A409VHG7_9AGAR|nr:hypothetical protein CVT24_011765 [Panaeolus cyanescens]
MLGAYKSSTRDYHALERPPKRPRSWPNALVWLSLLLNACFLLEIIRRWNGWTVLNSQGQTTTLAPLRASLTDKKQATCGLLDTLGTSPLAHDNIWHYLSRQEMLSIKNWLEDPAQNLNLTRNSASSISDNKIFMIDLYNPTKESALHYLSGGPKPDRYARVTIHHGGMKDPVIRDYLVGPLPIGSDTTVRRLTEIYHRPDFPLNVRGVDDLSEMARFLMNKVMPIAHALEDLFSAVVKGGEDDTITPGLTGPFSYDGSFRRLWMTWRRNTAGSFIHPLNFYHYIDISGTDPSKWSILKIVYHDQVFSSNEEFLEAYNNGTLKRHQGQTRPLPDLSWSQRNRTGPLRDLDALPGPRSVSFSGRRFRVNKEQQHISWMGWDMYLGFDRDMGLKLWNIRFDRFGRIIYELSPQEAIAQYAGNDPAQASTAWLDRYFGMGGFVRSMIPHYDCPQDAVYLPATTFSTFGIVEVPRAICVFEQDTGRPLTRHYGFAPGEFGSSKTYVLTIRSTTTVGNYDYLDFDIAGQSNSLLRTSTHVEEVHYDWMDEDWGHTSVQQRINRDIISNEDDALLKYPPNFQGHYAIVNQEEKNAWGSSRGYAIHPGVNPIHNTVVGSKRLLNNANWARYNLAVSRRKDTEPSSSSMWNQHLSAAPPVDFHNFFDGENIEQQDLVAWINLGMHHLPQSEDSPMTKTNIATSSQRHLATNAARFGSEVKWDNNGVAQDFHCTPPTPDPFEYSLDRVYPLEDGELGAAGMLSIKRISESYLRMTMNEL